MEISKQDILSFFKRCDSGFLIPGLITNRYLSFLGIEIYQGRGKYSHLRGSDTILVKSEYKKKRNIYRLFLEPLEILSNCTAEELEYGRIPAKFVSLEHAEEGVTYPNLYEYEVHYKSVARFIQQNLAIHLSLPSQPKS